MKATHSIDSNVPQTLKTRGADLPSLNSPDKRSPKNVQAIIADTQEIKVTKIITPIPVIPPPNGSMN